MKDSISPIGKLYRGRIVRPCVYGNILKSIRAFNMFACGMIDPAVLGPVVQRAFIGHPRYKHVESADSILNHVPSPRCYIWSHAVPLRKLHRFELHLLATGSTPRCITMALRLFANAVQAAVNVTAAICAHKCDRSKRNKHEVQHVC